MQKLFIRKYPLEPEMLKVPDETFAAIEKSILSGNQYEYSLLIEPILISQKIKCNEKGLDTEIIDKELEEAKEQRDLLDEKKKNVLSEFFIYQTLKYDFPQSAVLDMVKYYAKEYNLSEEERKNLEGKAIDVSKTYVRKYSSEYDTDVRVNLDDSELRTKLDANEEQYEASVSSEFSSQYKFLKEEVDEIIKENNIRDREEDAVHRGEIAPEDTTFAKDEEKENFV